MPACTKKKNYLFDYHPGCFEREDESQDRIFYQKPRFVEHLDSNALRLVEHIVGTLIIEPAPRILDLMASWDSHIPDSVKPELVIGLGLNEEELRANPKLTQYVIHDINETPTLPFPDNFFDVVLNTVSVDYMTRPFEIFSEVGRILRPGGLFLVTFSNRYFPPKAVRIWKELTEEERLILVADYFSVSGLFEEPSFFISKGKKRPSDDKYAHLNIPSDPVYAVYGEKVGGDPNRPKRPEPTDPEVVMPPSELSHRELKEWVAKHRQCPYCGEKLKKWLVPLTPFTEWDTEYFYICFNDNCPYFLRGWMAMLKQGNLGFSYRFRFNPKSSGIDAMPVPHPNAYRESIVEEE
ncbi:MAG: methyltransferase domain-containing protein [Thermodesulforhabdaceae bacterium]